MMLTQATGSSAVGALRAAGVGFDVIFNGSAAGLLVVLAALTALWTKGWLHASGEPGGGDVP